MTPAPFQAVYETDEQGPLFRPLRRFANVLAAEFGRGEIVTLERHEERSEKSHKHEFAWLKPAWQSLPESIAADFPSVEHLRKRALIATGWCTIRDHACASKAEAQRLAIALRGEVDPYTAVVVRDDVVRVLRARSQARGKMKAAEFQASKQAILDWVADLLGSDPASLERHGRKVA